jgi:hypothetical protein
MNRNNRERSRVRSNRMCQYPLTLNYSTLRNKLTSEWIIRLILLSTLIFKVALNQLTLSHSHIWRLIWTLTHWLSLHIRLTITMNWLRWIDSKKIESTIFFFFIIIKCIVFESHKVYSAIYDLRHCQILNIDIFFTITLKPL